MYYKYEVEKQQVSYDGGLTWTDTYVTRRSDNYVGVYNTLSECETGIVPQYRTVSGSPYCDGYDKKEDLYYQVSYDSGATWSDVSSSTTVIEYNSEDCGYVPPTPPTPSEYLTIESLEDNNEIYWKKQSCSDQSVTISASTDGGATWTAYTSTCSEDVSQTSGGVVIATLNTGQKVLLKGVEGSCESSITSRTYKRHKAYGNIMSLIYGDNFVGQTIIPSGITFERLFNYQGYVNPYLTDVSNLSLPATTLSENCYKEMFFNCRSLTVAPVLPATTLETRCYQRMFYHCESLTVAPVLPATTLADYCYNGMFEYCSGLTTAPSLPATTMINGCYMYMFQNCTSLTTAPELPATTLVNNCYYYMFRGCSNLNYIKAMFTTTPSTSYTKNWVEGVAATGTFVKNSAATWTTTGVNGIPNNWTVQNA